MRIEVICTGDELLTGLTADTNSPYFMARLLELGERVAHSQCVPDDRAAIIEALSAVRERADFVLVSGGLGPTSDDLTAECAAKAAQRPLVEDAFALKVLQERFARRGLELTPNNLRQAQVPQGAEVVINPVGSAPMFIQRLGRCTLFFVPGVPREYRALVDGEVLPRIERALQALPGRPFHRLRILKTVRLPESHLDARVSGLQAKHPAVTFGFRTRGAENELKLLAKAASAADATAVLESAEADCRAVLGDYCYGVDDETLPGVVAAELRRRNHRLAIAESCSGGRLLDTLAGVAGASEWLWGGAVAYTEPSKTELAQVSPELLRAKSAVSAEATMALAKGIRMRARVEWSVAVTGYAGPGGGTAEDPIGTVYLAVDGEGGTSVERHRLGGERERVRQFAAVFALEMLRRRLGARE